MRTLCGIALAVLTVGCATEEDLYDLFPVSVDLSSGAVLIRARSGTGGEPYVAVVDTLSPVTVVDNFQPGEITPATRRQVDLVFCDQSDPPIERWLFPAVPTIDTHPCGWDDALCQVGLGNATTELRAVVGADVLGRGAISFEMPLSQIRFFPDIAGDNTDRGRACEAVFESPFAGGGTVNVSGADLLYPARRIALGACISYGDNPLTEGPTGTAVLLVLSTGLGTTILSHSAYDRYVEMLANDGDDSTSAPARSDLPLTELYLPSGAIEARLGSISRIALVGEGSDQRGPCEERWANHLMSVNTAGCNTDGVDLAGRTCPCTDNRTFCSTAAAVEMKSVITVAIVSDLERVLQALRDELRPKLPEVDGILGVNAIAPLRVDVDYQNDRVLAACQDSTDCITRPAVRNRNAVADIAPCLPDPWAPAASPTTVKTR